MPLAIELAAVQLRSFTPRQIADHLDERFQMLSGGLRTADPRQKTLAAAIDWSYQLLNDDEQLMFARLSAFHGGFDLEGAQQVCSGAGIEADDVFSLVLALTDKSLITADIGGDVARYRLLEMLRQFASDKLDVVGETDAIQRRHARYFLRLAEEAEPNIRGETEKKWWDRINTELDNLGVAMEWSIDVEEPELGMRLAGAIWRFWKVTFRYSAGVRWLSRLSEAGAEVDGIVRAKVMLGLGTLMSYTDSPAAARGLLENAIEIYRGLDAQGIDPTLLRHGYPAAILSLATNAWQHDRDYDGATELWAEALEIARRIGDDAGASTALGNLAEAAARKGDVRGAREGYIESIRASYALNSTHRTVEAITLSAVFEMSIDEPSCAIPLLDDAIEMARSDDLPFWDDFGLAMHALASHDLEQPGADERFRECAAKLFANDEFLATYYYQLPLILGLADMEYSAGRPDRAAILLGALERLEDENSPLEPIFEGTRRGRLLEALPEELGASEFADAFERGKALRRREVVDLAIGS
jgi:tetratricopeptide (TPR) repeat protein